MGLHDLTNVITAMGARVHQYIGDILLYRACSDKLDCLSSMQDTATCGSNTVMDVFQSAPAEPKKYTVSGYRHTRRDMEAVHGP